MAYVQASVTPLGMARHHGRRNARLGSHTGRIWCNPGNGVPPKHGARLPMGPTDLRGPDGRSPLGPFPGSARSRGSLRRLFLRTIYEHGFPPLIRSKPIYLHEGDYSRIAWDPS